MVGVLAGFFVVWAVILVGMFAGRRCVLPGNAQSVLSVLSFYVALPALLFEMLSQARLNDIFGAPLFVAAAGSLATAGMFFLITKLFLKRTAAESVMGSMNASLANWGNLGIPIATYVLKDPQYVAPLVVFQLAFFTPLLLVGMDATSGRHRATPVKLLLSIVRNPVILGAALGMLVAGTGIGIPDLIMEPVQIVGGAAVPTMLLAFGMSLNGSVPLQAAHGQRPDTLLASGFKLVVHPLLAYAFARFVLHQEPSALFAAVVMAAMPTAQNAFVMASRYDTLLTATKDTVLITTLIAVPTMIAIALLLS